MVIEPENGRAEVKAARGTTWTLVDDLGLCTFAVHGDGDHLVTMRAIVPIMDIQSNDEVRGGIKSTTSAIARCKDSELARYSLL